MYLNINDTVGVPPPAGTHFFIISHTGPNLLSILYLSGICQNMAPRINGSLIIQKRIQTYGKAFHRIRN
jgi:hypothetical protein